MHYIELIMLAYSTNYLNTFLNQATLNARELEFMENIKNFFYLYLKS